jgi:hypothetical protein
LSAISTVVGVTRVLQEVEDRLAADGRAASAGVS